VRKGTTAVWRWEELHAERVQTAKRLIDQTPMPLSEIAFVAGFRSRGGSTIHSARPICVRRLVFCEPQLLCIEAVPAALALKVASQTLLQSGRCS
jgi:hypothetical protein